MPQAVAIHSNYNKLNKMIDARQPVKLMRELILEDPLVLVGPHQKKSAKLDLVEGYDEQEFEPPLIRAIRKDNTEQVKLLLELLGDKDISDKIMGQLRRDSRIKDECSLEHPFYAMAPLGNSDRFLPHAYVQSPEMLQVLHDHGYNLNAVENDRHTSFLERHIVNAIEQIKSRDPNVPAYNFPAILSKAVELGMEINGKKFSLKNGEKVDAASYAYSKFMHNIASSVDNDEFNVIHPEMLPNFIKALGNAGIDCRRVLTYGEQFGPIPELEGWLRNTESELKSHFVKTPEAYLKTKEPGERRKLALRACAGGTFVQLLNQCIERDVKTGDSKEFTTLVSYLTPYWEKEYQHTIQTASAMLARTSRTPDDVQSGAIGKYLGTPKPTQRGGA